MTDDQIHCYHHTCTSECEDGCDDAANDDCVCCECCCTCLGCEYGPRDGMLMFPEAARR